MIGTHAPRGVSPLRGRMMARAGAGLEGRVSDLVAEEARRWDADLIVVGTHGRRGVRRLVLGSDAEQILRAAPVPVLLVRSTEPQAPAGEANAGSGPRAKTGIPPAS